MQESEVIIIGAGAAGLMCAATAGFRGRKVLLLDHSNKVGKKILMSGGGRCNFTNLNIESKNFISRNPHFCKSALSRYTQQDFIDLVSSYDLKYHEKKRGQLFCDNRSKDILNILLEECEKSEVQIKTSCKIIEIKKEEDIFKINTSEGDYQCESLVIATGGLSIPTLGATGFGYDIARQFDLKIIPYQASLVPFTLKSDLLDQTQELAGVSLETIVSCGSQSFRESILFTHKGLSGPVILQISNYWNHGDEIRINFLPDRDLFENLKVWKNQGMKSELRTKLGQIFPKRFVQLWLKDFDSTKPICEYSDKDLRKVGDHFHNWKIIPKGTEGYKTAEVTRGGVDTNEISSKTFEAKKVSGLYFIGEVLDVTGWLGGYNFQWAWSSGWCAGKYI